MLRACALGRELVEGLDHCTHLKMLSAQGVLNIPAVLGAEQLLLFLGGMRALQLVADGLSGLSPQLFFQGVASTVSAGGRIKDFLNCVSDGRVCLAMPWKGEVVSCHGDKNCGTRTVPLLRRSTGDGYMEKLKSRDLRQRICGVTDDKSWEQGAGNCR